MRDLPSMAGSAPRRRSATRGRLPHDPTARFLRDLYLAAVRQLSAVRSAVADRLSGLSGGVLRRRQPQLLQSPDRHGEGARLQHCVRLRDAYRHDAERHVRRQGAVAPTAPFEAGLPALWQLSDWQPTDIIHRLLPAPRYIHLIQAGQAAPGDLLLPSHGHRHLVQLRRQRPCHAGTPRGVRCHAHRILAAHDAGMGASLGTGF